MTMVGSKSTGQSFPHKLVENIATEEALELPPYGGGFERELTVTNENLRRHGRIVKTAPPLKRFPDV
jgi:hypothetical protein